MEGTTFGNVPLNLEVQAGSVGLAQLRRRGDRCGALRQTGPRPGHLRCAAGPFIIFHEVSCRTVSGLEARQKTEAFIAVT